MHEFASTLAAAGVNGVRCDESLARHSSWMIGGPADVFAEPASARQIAICAELSTRWRIPLLVIGHGTNLLFSDEGLRGLVMKIGPAYSSIAVRGNRIVADAGAWVPGLAMLAMRKGLSGIEHTIGIPGTLGGLVVMNGGSRRQGIGSVVRRASLVDRNGRPFDLSQSECEFSYRTSVIQGTENIICSVELELTPAPIAKIRSECLSILRDRRHKFPRKERSCGSVFLSTPELHAKFGPPGKIIEEAGLKGFRIGGAEVSTQHANFVLNRGGATARDILQVIGHMRRTAMARAGVMLQCEVKHALPSAQIVPGHAVAP
jgi:UDP-N-acetylmuramate dehydrogenase